MNFIPSVLWSTTSPVSDALVHPGIWQFGLLRSSPTWNRRNGRVRRCWSGKVVPAIRESRVDFCIFVMRIVLFVAYMRNGNATATILIFYWRNSLNKTPTIYVDVTSIITNLIQRIHLAIHTRTLLTLPTIHLRNP